MYQSVWLISTHPQSRKQCTHLFPYASNYQAENVYNETICNKKGHGLFSLPLLLLMQENISKIRSKNCSEPTNIQRLAAGGSTTCSCLSPEKTIAFSEPPAVVNSSDWMQANIEEALFERLSPLWKVIVHLL